MDTDPVAEEIRRAREEDRPFPFPRDAANPRFWARYARIAVPDADAAARLLAEAPYLDIGWWTAIAATVDDVGLRRIARAHGYTPRRIAQLLHRRLESLGAWRDIWARLIERLTASRLLRDIARRILRPDGGLEMGLDSPQSPLPESDGAVGCRRKPSMSSRATRVNSRRSSRRATRSRKASTRSRAK